MLTATFNQIVRRVLATRSRRIERFKRHPFESQERMRTTFLQRAAYTAYGRQFGFDAIRTYEDFSGQLPLQDYEGIRSFIHRTMLGEADVLWPGKTKWFAKSSGTTDAKSKYIPVSGANLRTCHIRSTWDALTFFYRSRPDARIFADKNLVITGSLSRFAENPKAIIGDVSAIMLQNIPTVGRPFYTPDFETALLDDWEEKINRMTKICSQDNVVMFGGVPTWIVVLFRRILEYTGKSSMREVWPNAQAYFHGGVGFKPYEKQFEAFFPEAKLTYVEVYNASEGYFAVRDEPSAEGMLLLLDNGIFYEFLPIEELHSEQPRTIPLKDVEIGKHYALVITTNSGLWRYLPGDTVCFTSLTPHRILVTGRTKQFINTFGEEVMVTNTDNALALTCSEYDARVEEYTVAPVYMHNNDRGGHQWIVEFDKQPENVIGFAQRLDKNLQRLNSDYEAKRYGDLALLPLKLQTVPSGTFHRWMQSRGKVGGQHKVPRLSNDRRYVDDILDFIQQADSNGIMGNYSRN